MVITSLPPKKKKQKTYKTIRQSHVFHGIFFMFHAPAGDRGMFRGRDGVPRGFPGAVVPAAAQQGRHGVGAQEVHQVGGTSQGGAFHRGDATKTEVVEFEHRAACGGLEVVVGRWLEVVGGGEVGRRGGGSVGGGAA